MPRPILFLPLILLAACAAHIPTPIADLTQLQQDAAAYSDRAPEDRLLTVSQQQEAYTDFIARHFGPWQRSTPSHTADQAFWGFETFGDDIPYGENTLPLPSHWMDAFRHNSRVSDYPSMSRRAIAVTNTSMRVLPTNRPAFRNFSEAGEGYPFDYLQNSLVLAGTPLYACHASADGAWIMIESRFAFGWVAVNDIAWVDDAFAAAFMTGTYAAFTKDDIPIQNTDNHYTFRAHIGTILPLTQHTNETSGLTLLLPIRTATGDASIQRTTVSTSVAQTMPIAATPSNFSRLANAMLGRQYGWGGLYEDRDCSATTMDLMAGFGIYLPRNSSQQAKTGTVIPLGSLNRTVKREFIAKTATPFLTLIRKPGHIMLYIGTHNGDPIVLHSLWGLKVLSNGKEGRRVVGRTVITTLEPGLEQKNLARPSGILLERVTAMTTLPGSAQHESQASNNCRSF